MTAQILLRDYLAKPDAERAAFLAGALAARPDLRTEFESLLMPGEATASYEPPVPNNDGDRTRVQTSDVSLTQGTSDFQLRVESGTLIAGRYTLLEKIGEGGMGEVWIAKQSEPVKRKVAIKLIRSGFDTKAVLARFEQERQALAMMDHPNIAKVLDGGVTADQRPFLVMELVNGLPLNRFCDEARLTPRQRLELFVPICHAVQHAHQKGIIHRDLKPANILVTIIDGTPVPMVIDFGVAKATGGKLTDETLSTQFGAVVGTLEYMSPEQAGFSGVDIDTRADIYSLGVILYELLTGLRPIDVKRLKKAALSEMIRVIQEEEPSKPSTRLSTDESLPSLAALRQTEPRKLMALLRGELDWVVMKCLEKQRDRRYETANGLARDIQHYLADEMVEARPPSAGYRIGKFMRKNRAMLTSAGAILLLLCAGVIVSMWQAVRATRAEETALRDRNRAIEAEGQAKLRAEETEVARQAESKHRRLAERRQAGVEAVNKFLTTDMITAADPEKAQGRDVTVKEVLDRAAGKVGITFQKQPEIEALIRVALGKTYINLSKYAAAEAQLTRAFALSTAALGEANEDTLEISTLLAAAYMKAGKLAEAETLYRKTLPLWQEHLAKDHLGVIVLKSDMALLLHLRGKDEEAETMMIEIIELQKRTRRADGKRELMGISNLALLKLDLGKPKEAEPLAREAVTACLDEYGEKHPNTLTAMNTLGRVLQALNKIDEAIPLYRKIVEQRRVVQGNDHSDTLVALSNLASMLQSQGQLDEAEPLYRESMAGLRKLHGDEHADTISLLNNLASFYFARRKYAEAEPLFRQAQATFTKLHGKDHPTTLQITANLATTIASQGKHVEAEPLYRDVLAAQTRVLGAQHPMVAQSLHNLADALREQKKWDESVKLFRESLAIWRAKLPADHPNTIGTLAALGWALTDKGDAKEAETVLREAFTSVQKALPKGHPSIFHIQSLLGGSLTAQARYDDAEPILLTAYESMALSPKANLDRLRMARQRIIQLYDASGRKDKAEEWRKKEDVIPKPPPEKK